MIETRIELPGAPAELRKQVEAADAMLHDRAKNSQGLKFSGVWSADGSAPVTERVRLTLRLGPDEISRSVPVSDLAEPKRARDAIRDAMWDVSGKSYRRTADALLAVVEEIKSELAPVG